MSELARRFCQFRFRFPLCLCCNMHPAHAPRPALRLGPKEQKIVGGQTSGRDRQDMGGAADPESGNARLIEVLSLA
jgi:hypothetical protein